jgi:hypothetical protein
VKLRGESHPEPADPRPGTPCIECSLGIAIGKLHRRGDGDTAGPND